MTKTHFASTRLRCSSSRGLSSKASLSAHWWQGGHGGVCTGHEAWRLVVVVGKKPLPAATTGRDESRHVVRDPRLGSFHGYGFKRHRLSCRKGDMLRHAHSCLRDVSVDDGWPLRIARAQSKQGRRSCSQTFLKKPLFRHLPLPTRCQPLL